MVGSRDERDVFLWTDLQRIGIRSPLVTAFPARRRVEVMDVGRPISRNLAVELVQAEQTDLRKASRCGLTARVFNAGLFPARDVRVSLVLEGKSPMEQNITIAGPTPGAGPFDVPIDKPAFIPGLSRSRGR